MMDGIRRPFGNRPISIRRSFASDIVSAFASYELEAAASEAISVHQLRLVAMYRMRVNCELRERRVKTIK